ncbi:amidohydrolase family protein [Saccharopolyspora sp. K220]|uniref:amidohydrolase family protein n=1 Tax=Saccharopolyspora soli TaxID=2926618 RepID=UPI001F5819D3|nr:amidohydrolase family protein [Saccharopolyspora soli]MCI2421431.1 amidohydrolase family protein [Saccharopolyspora soli]
MRRITLEEAIWFDDLKTHGTPKAHEASVYRPEVLARWTSRLTDITAHRLPEMDEHGIDMQVLSLTSPGIQAQADASVAVDDAKRANDHFAEIVNRWPDRFTALAALPLQDPQAAAGELRRAVTELGLRGALVNDHTLGHYLDEPQYEPVWAELQGLDVPIYLHPSGVVPDEWHVLGGHPELVGPTYSWTAATGAHALRLIYGGVFDRFAGARVILGHMGEFLPFQLARFDARHADLQLDDGPVHPPSEYLTKNFAITTSGVCSHAALLGAVMAIGIDNVLFAVDYPYESTADAVAFLDAAPLAEADRRRIAHGNAERLLKLGPAV